MFFSDEYSFNDGWKFALTLASGVEKESFDDRQFKLIELPHDWQIHNRRDPEMELGGNQGYFSREQVGWYRKRFTAPPEWMDKTVYMVIDGCQRFYDVYLNGERVGGHRYGYVPEIITLNDGLRFGEENLICVKVDNAHTLGDRWYSGAGLYQGIRLMVKGRTTDDAHICVDRCIRCFHLLCLHRCFIVPGRDRHRVKILSGAVSHYGKAGICGVKAVL